MNSDNHTNRESSEKAAHEEIEKRLRDEAQHTVDYLERALESAPDDEQLRTRLLKVLEQARALRDAVERALSGAAQAHEPGHEEPPVD